MEPSVVSSWQIPAELAKRFVLGRNLGRGGFGVVYEAFDRSLGTDVALKELLSMEPAALYAFKQEFRALADVVHENLVGLHELISVEGRFFLTMELVRGVSFLRFVRPKLEGRADPSGPRMGLPPTAQRAIAAELVTAATMSLSAMMITADAADATRSSDESFGQTLALGSLDANAPPRLPLLQPDALAGELDPDLLRRALGELAEGVLVIHRAGRAHRDLKPSNVLVTPEGRAVILDFGLVGALEAIATDRVLILGTPAYMSPEQAAGASGDAASDWYAVGVMLYEALTGAVPHLYEDTTVEELLYRKHLVDPPPPSSLVPSVPEDLSDLTMRLLDRDPTTRAGAAEVFRVVKKEGARASSAAEAVGARPRFVGRGRELSAMREAWESCVQKNQIVVLHVHGPSGMGKSDLVRHFFEELASSEAPLVLEGRCHEREWVPYKAFDGAIDVLSRRLAELDERTLAALLPPGFSYLARLFPVLGRIGLEGAIRTDEPDLPEPHELRRRAFDALRELCTRLSARWPLVFYVDDLQWADTDSAALFEALLAAPALPRLLFVASYRTDEARSSTLVQDLPHPSKTSAIASREVVVGPLATEDAEALALATLGRDDDEAKQNAARIAREAGGSPFFVQELARFSASGHSTSGLDLRGVVTARVAVLPEAARLALEIVSAAGSPIEPFLVKEAAGLEDEGARRALSMLRANGLLRAKGGKDEARVEPYHDKIREIVVQNLNEATLSARHRALGEVMEHHSNADPEALAMHFRMAGEPSRARAYMERAAERAERVLAFDRAATLYKLALELAAPADVGALELRLGDALAKAGRGAEAAAAFLSAAAKVSEELSLVARQRAVEHLLRAGHMDEGLAAVRELLPRFGMSLPKTPRHAFLNVVASRLRMRLRGYEFQEKSESEIERSVLHRIDLCWSLGNGLGGVDAIRGADFQARHLLFALEAGEPWRIARALAWEAVLSGLRGDPQSIANARQLAARAEEIAKRIQHPHALAWAEAAHALNANNTQQFRKAAEISERCIELFREARSDTTWELGSMYSWWLLPSLFYTAQIPKLYDLIPRCVSEAQSLGDRYMETALGAYMQPVGLILQDKPEEALACARRALSRWSTLGYHTMHWGALNIEVFASLYMGQGRRAYAQLHSQIAMLHSSMLTWTSKNLRIRLADFQARAALAAAREVARPERLIQEALDVADTIEGERTPWSDGVALAVRAAVLARRGEVDRALAQYARSRSAFRSADMEIAAMGIERRMGVLEGGEAGRSRVSSVDTWMRERGIVRPDAWTAASSAG